MNCQNCINREMKVFAQSDGLQAGEMAETKPTNFKHGSKVVGKTNFPNRKGAISFACC
jgi:hypothetical protein